MFPDVRLGVRAGRLLSILILLQLRVRLTAGELAEEFEVSVRTIYRDIEELSAAGVPIYGESGPGGGFRLVDGYRTRLTGLAADEAEAVFMIGMPGAANALGLGAAAETAGRKLLASLPPALSDGAGRLGARFHLDPVEWYHQAAAAPLLPALARAVLDCRMVSMVYESWTAVRPWRVEPLGLVLKAASWYLVARGGEAVRIYKVGAVRELTVEDASFERPADFDLGVYWHAELARFEASLRPGTAELRVSPEGCARLARLGRFAAEAVAAAGPPDADGWRVVRLPIENVAHASRQLLGIGPELEVTAPPALREDVRELACQVARRHRPDAERR